MRGRIVQTSTKGKCIKMQIQKSLLVLAGKVGVISYALAILSLFTLPDTVFGMQKMAVIEGIAIVIAILILITYLVIKRRGRSEH